MKRVAIFNDTSVSGHYGCFAVMSVLKKSLEERGMQIAFFWPVSEDWRAYKKEIKKRKFDVAVVNGEGSIHHSKHRAKARYLSELACFMNREVGVPCFLINASIFDIDDDTFSNLNFFTEIYVRESASRNYLLDNSVKSKTVPDLSFFSLVHHPKARNRSLSEITVTDSVKENSARELEELSENLSAKYVKMDNYHHVTVTSKIIKKVSRRMRIAPLQKDIKPICDFEGFISALMATSALITGRFHASTLGLLTRTPVWAIESNTPKISSMLIDVFGNDQRCFSEEEIKERVKKKTFADDVSYSENELRAIELYLELGKNKKNEMFDQISRA